MVQNNLITAIATVENTFRSILHALDVVAWPLAYVIGTFWLLSLLVILIILILSFRPKDTNKQTSSSSYSKTVVPPETLKQHTSNVFSLAAAREIRVLRNEHNEGSLHFKDSEAHDDGPTAA